MRDAGAARGIRPPRPFAAEIAAAFQLFNLSTFQPFNLSGAAETAAVSNLAFT